MKVGDRVAFRDIADVPPRLRGAKGMVVDVKHVNISVELPSDGLYDVPKWAIEEGHVYSIDEPIYKNGKMKNKIKL